MNERPIATKMKEDNDSVMARMKEETGEGKTCGAPHRMLLEGHAEAFKNQAIIMGAVEDLTDVVKKNGSGTSITVGKFTIKAKTASDMVKIAAALVMLVVGLEYMTRRIFPQIGDKLGGLLNDKAVETFVESGSVGTGMAVRVR